MRTHVFRCLWALLLIHCSVAIPGPLPTKQITQLVDYHESGQYYQDLSAAVKEATCYLQFRLLHNARTRSPKKLAVVFDLDETLLSNFTALREHQFDPKILARPQPQSTAIAHTLALYEYAREHDVAIFLISSRPKTQLAATIAQLHRLGYRDWAGLLLAPSANSPPDYRSFVQMRRQLVAAGYDILLNVGTQTHTLRGGQADMTLRLPNPFYTTR